MKTDIREVGNSEASQWNDFICNRSDSSTYHRYEWRKFFVEVFGKETHYLAAFQRDTIVGILPIVRQKSLIFGDFLSSLPFFNYGGVVAENPAIRCALKDQAIDLGKSLGVSHIELREQQPYSGLSNRTDKVSMILELPETAGELSKSLGSKRRSQVRRADRENPDVSVGGLDIVDSFYAVFSRNMRDLGTPVYPKTMFEEILKRFPDNAQIVAVEVDGVPAAAAFLLHHNQVSEVPWASADRRFNKISINMFLYWQILVASIQRGSTKFDFGRSTIDSGPYRFKKQWGATPTQLVWSYWKKDGKGELDLNPQSSKYKLASTVWKKLPLSVSNAIGPYLVKNLP